VGVCGSDLHGLLKAGSVIRNSNALIFGYEFAGETEDGQHVGIFGCRPIGLLIIQLAKLSGAANIRL
jgi:threonine dehydrogenase-like Zn-dependent dehydrogenase